MGSQNLFSRDPVEPLLKTCGRHCPTHKPRQSLTYNYGLGPKSPRLKAHAGALLGCNGSRQTGRCARLAKSSESETLTFTAPLTSNAPTARNCTAAQKAPRQCEKLSRSCKSQAPNPWQSQVKLWSPEKPPKPFPSSSNSNS